MNVVRCLENPILFNKADYIINVTEATNQENLAFSSSIAYGTYIYSLKAGKGQDEHLLGCDPRP